MNNEMRFKTTINCGGCVAKVTPLLNNIEGLEWEVDTNSQQKILTARGVNVSAEEVSEAVRKAGFRIEPIAE